MKNFVSIADSSPEEIKDVLRRSQVLRQQRAEGTPNPAVLAGKTIVQIFEKPSLRTRVSFSQAVFELGGNTIFLGSDVGLDKRESVRDVIGVLDGMVDGVVARVFEHQKLLDMVRFGNIPVINALSDWLHPCQVMADALTMWDAFGEDLEGKTLAYVGDANNIVRSLANLTGKLGMNYVIATPEGYQLDGSFVEQILAAERRSEFRMVRDPKDAVRGADVVYTDIWASMGWEKEREVRRHAFQGYQVNCELLQAASDHAIVMHCLPAAQNLEISDEVKYGEQSRIFQQAHNRLHVQKGLFAKLFDSSANQQR